MYKLNLKIFKNEIKCNLRHYSFFFLTWIVYKMKNLCPKEAQQTWIYNFKFRMAAWPGESVESKLSPGHGEILIFIFFHQAS